MLLEIVAEKCVNDESKLSLDLVKYHKKSAESLVLETDCFASIRSIESWDILEEMKDSHSAIKLFEKLSVRQDCEVKEIMKHPTKPNISNHELLAMNETLHENNFQILTFYNENIYLSELLFVANILNPKFQTEFQRVFNECMEIPSTQYLLMEGPIKQASRIKEKCQTKYKSVTFPSSAKVGVYFCVFLCFF